MARSAISLLVLTLILLIVTQARATPSALLAALKVGAIFANGMSMILRNQSSGAAPTFEAILQNRELLKQHSKQLSDSTGMLIELNKELLDVSEKIDQLPAIIREDISSALNQKTIDELNGALLTVLTEMQAIAENIERKVGPEHFLARLVLLRNELMQKSYLNAPAILLAMPYELEFRFRTGESAESIDLERQKYTDWLRAAISDSRPKSLVRAAKEARIAHYDAGTYISDAFGFVEENKVEWRSHFTEKSAAIPPAQCTKLLYCDDQKHPHLNIWSTRSPDGDLSLGLGARYMTHDRFYVDRLVPKPYFVEIGEDGCQEATLADCEYGRVEEVEGRGREAVSRVASYEARLPEMFLNYYHHRSVEFMYRQTIEAVRNALNLEHNLYMTQEILNREHKTFVMLPIASESIPDVCTRMLYGASRSSSAEVSWDYNRCWRMAVARLKRWASEKALGWTYQFKCLTKHQYRDGYRSRDGSCENFYWRESDVFAKLYRRFTGAEREAEIINQERKFHRVRRLMERIREQY